MASSGLSSSVWCYQCSRFVRTSGNQVLTCRRCRGEFIEQLHNPPPHPSPDSIQNSSLGLITIRRHRMMNPGSRSQYNPVVVLRRPDADDESDMANFQLYFDDNSGLGLQQMPSDATEMLMSSGFDRLLNHLTQLENNGVWRSDKPPAFKPAINSLPTVVITNRQVAADSHCAICTEQFELNAEAKEMPCKHIYHSSCILPWLAFRNSCPVCRHELLDGPLRGNKDDEIVGLTIWRLPGGGFAVGRFTTGEAEFPLVYTEMDGGLNIGSSISNGNSVSRGIRWTSRGSNSRVDSGGFSSTIRQFLSFFARRRRSSS